LRSFPDPAILRPPVMRRTKIVATVGPASQEPAVLERLLDAGADVLRLNFSHGDHQSHQAVYRSAREIAARQGRPLGILQDLSGPKIRTGAVQDGQIDLVDGAELAITTDESVVGTPRLISTTYEPLPRDVVVGNRILLDDGNLELKVRGVKGNQVLCEVVHGGVLKSHKGMNLPGAKLSTPALTEKDRRDLAFGVTLGVDYVALSFVRQAADVRETRELLHSLGSHTPVIAKIEKREAIDDLANVIEAANGVMVARGDLGVELSTEEVPTLQKRIIQQANASGKAVITATQMLESMIENPRPTRAEASDVANAILDGTDAIMLSAETAAGRFPVEAVETMSRIASYTEAHCAVVPVAKLTGGEGSQISRSLSRVAASVADELSCDLIVAFTESGITARLLSAFRPRVPIVALSHDQAVFNRLSLRWGVVPVKATREEDTVSMVRHGLDLLKAQGLTQPGHRILLLAGKSQAAGATNMMRVHTVE
jgi:pyruvate kinase